MEMRVCDCAGKLEPEREKQREETQPSDGKIGFVLKTSRVHVYGVIFIFTDPPRDTRVCVRNHAHVVGVLWVGCGSCVHVLMFSSSHADCDFYYVQSICCWVCRECFTTYNLYIMFGQLTAKAVITLILFICVDYVNKVSNTLNTISIIV